MAAPANYNLQDAGDNGWEFELDFSEWDTQVIVQWIFELDEDENFGDDYEEKFNIRSISGQHFKRNQLGNEQWCRTDLGMNQQIAKSFSAIVRQRITKYENHRKKSYVPQMPIKSYVPQIPKPIEPNYTLQDGGNGWEFELDFAEWDTAVIIQWIFVLDENFGDNYEEKFNIRSISGQHFKRKVSQVYILNGISLAMNSGVEIN
eukprot:45992_1